MTNGPAPPAPARRPVITGLDLPADAPGGSVELLYDLYASPGAPLHGQVFMLRPSAGAGITGRDTRSLALLDVPGKTVDDPLFGTYLRALTAALAAAITPPDGTIMHLQHLAFGASPALLDAFPRLPGIALVHGTDLLYAEAHTTQARVLHRITEAADRIVVPTVAMADRLRRLTPGLRPAHLEHIPWGIPAQLLTRPPHPRPRPSGDLRLLYAGRLTTEKGGRQLITACTNLPGIRLSIAAPPSQYADLSRTVDMSAIRWLGWLPRSGLWEAFGDHDLLVVPSTVLEAFGLVAVEAQACGLPVLHHPVPGLREVLAGSALPVDLADPAALASELDWLRNDPAALTDLRIAGLANAARYPLAATAQRLAELGEQIA
jgi:glycosyltransferase involved in cell wall biosynthesis